MSAWTVGAAVGTALAVALRWPPSVVLVRHRLALPGPRVVLRRPGAWPVVAIVGVVGLVTVEGPMLLVVLVGVGVAGFAARTVAAGRRRTAVLERRATVAGTLDLLGGELRAGALPEDAVTAVALDVPILASAAATARAGGDVAAALRAQSQHPGAEALADVAAAWEVAERAGAPLADVLERLAVGVRDELESHREAEAEAAPARATGRLMAGLPVMGLALGAGLGADPLHVLTSTFPGAVCLAAGAALACLGTWWVDRVAGPPAPLPGSFAAQGPAPLPGSSAGRVT